jgi:hypothetical protein
MAHVRIFMLFVLELCLFLILYLEEPGPWLRAGALKTVSHGFEQHTGVGAALCLCLLVETCVVLREAPEVGWAGAALVYVAQVGTLGALVCPTGTDDRHMGFAITFFTATTALSLLLRAAGRTGTLQVAAQAACFVVLGAAMLYKWEEAVGPLELAYLYFMLNAWVEHRGPPGLGALVLRI